MTNKVEMASAGDITRLIRSIRDQRVILDNDLAAVYGVPTKRLNEQYRRNLARFPEDFAFRLTQDEWAALRSQDATLEASLHLRSQNATGSKVALANRSQNATGSQKHRDPRFPPLAFTEHGALMATNRTPQRARVRDSRRKGRAARRGSGSG